MADAIAILPARGGSKRIPRKNIRPFCGRPMIAWPIAAALASGAFARVVVSTDDAEIADVARGLGAEVPFVRDARLADDFADTKSVIADAVKRLALPDDGVACCLYPTAAFVGPQDLARGVAEMDDPAVRWVMSVAEYTTPVQRSYRIADGRLVPNTPEAMPKRSQDLEPVYFDAGQFYCARAGTWQDPTSAPWDHPKPVVLAKGRVIDIDSPEDWELAELVVRFLMDRGL
ncbi:MAG: pseudaminic acid cytidylyltransferase [Rhodospirillaceae bacterium]|nr:pseudaminic acid cytidylyltransferase [Rhodospirillaceae bacterium]